MIDQSRITFLDFESARFAPGYRVPEPAIATTYNSKDGARLWLTHELPEMLDRVLDDTERGGYLGGHDLGRFDAPIIAEYFPHLRPRLWQAFENDRIVDTLTAERILQIQRGQRGELALDACARNHGVPMASKADNHELRISFGQFIGATEIPPAHAKYALDDAIVLPQIFQRQVATQLVYQSDMAQLLRQTFALSLVSARGFRTDLDHVRELDRMVTERVDELEAIARECGFIRSSSKGELSRNMAAIHEAIARDYAPEVWDGLDGWRTAARNAWTGKRTTKTWEARAEVAYAEHVGKPDPWQDPRIPKTDTGRVRADRLTLEDTSDPKLQALSEWAQLLSVRNKDLKVFYEGAVQPVHTSFGITDTTRASHREPNAGNFGKLRGVRECIAPRPGFALAVSDFKMLELVSLAQLCAERLGLTTMANKIRNGIDMHAEIGADILGVSYEEIQRRRKAGDHDADEARDCGKPANFGLNGGMTSAETFQLYARKSYGQKLTIEQCSRIMGAWRDRAVDQRAWLAHVKQTRNQIGLFDMKHPGFEGLWRRGLKNTEASNNPFQIKGMQVARVALWKVVKAQKCTGELAGSHAVMFVHDDICSEVPEDNAWHHANIQARLMYEAALEVCPRVFDASTPIDRVVDTRVLSHLSKSAKATPGEITQVTMPERIGKAMK